MNRITKQFLIISLVLLCLSIPTYPSPAQPLSYGVRNAFAAGAQPFQLHSSNGVITLTLPGRAGLDDELCIEVVNFEQWRTNQDQRARASDLILFLDHKGVPGLRLQAYPERNWLEIVRAGDRDESIRTNHISYFGVKLEQTAANREIWKKILNSPDFELTRPVRVSIGFVGGDPMNTWVYPAALAKGESPFNFVIISAKLFWFGVGVVLFAFLAFLWLARKTDLLRDPNLPLRPDGRLQLSLARTQMAFWFFLVFAAFFFLWLVTGYTDSLNASTLTLIGISAGTAVSSAFIDSGRARVHLDDAVLRRNENESEPQLVLRLNNELKDVLTQLVATQQARQTLPSNDVVAIAANEQQEATLDGRRQRLEYQLHFIKWPLWRVAMQDLLNEGGVISFHRFQMCVWTVVLGIIFVGDVYSKAAMPEFDATLLGLMGVSAGTFIGFKMPAQTR